MSNEEINEQLRDIGNFVLQGQNGNGKWERIGRYRDLGSVRVALDEAISKRTALFLRVLTGSDQRVIKEHNIITPMPDEWYNDLRHSE